MLGLQACGTVPGFVFLAPPPLPLPLLLLCLCLTHHTQEIMAKSSVVKPCPLLSSNFILHVGIVFPGLLAAKTVFPLRVARSPLLEVTWPHVKVYFCTRFCSVALRVCLYGVSTVFLSKL